MPRRTSRSRRWAVNAVLAMIAGAVGAAQGVQQTGLTPEQLLRQQQEMVTYVEGRLRYAETARLRGDCEAWARVLDLQDLKLQSPEASLIPPMIRGEWLRRAAAAGQMPCPPTGADKPKNPASTSHHLVEEIRVEGDPFGLDLTAMLQRVLEAFAASEKANLEAAERCDLKGMEAHQERLFTLVEQADDIEAFTYDPGANLNFKLPSATARAAARDLETRLGNAISVSPKNCSKTQTTNVIGPAFDVRLLDPKPVKATSTRPLVILGGAAAVAGAVLATSGGGDTPVPNIAAPPSTPPPATPAPPPPPVVPAPSQPGPQDLNGVYRGNLTVTENGCRFSNSTPFAADINFHASGIGTIQFTYQLGNQLYTFNNVNVRMNGNQGVIEAETTSTQFGYRVLIQATVSGNAFTGSISFFDPGRGNCHTRYSMNGAK